MGRGREKTLRILFPSRPSVDGEWRGGGIAGQKKKINEVNNNPISRYRWRRLVRYPTLINDRQRMQRYHLAISMFEKPQVCLMIDFSPI